MFSSSSQSYQESFPPLEKQTNPQTKIVSQPFVQSPITFSGQPEALKQYEAALNWQTQNANAQNQALRNLGRKIDKVTTYVTKTETKVDSLNAQLEHIYLNLQNRISELDVDLITMINNRIWGLEFNKKESEIRKLKAELARIDADKEQPPLFTKTQSLPIPVPLFDTYQPFYNSSKPSMNYNKFFGLSHLLYRNQELPTPPPASTSPTTKVKISEPKPKESSPIPEDSPKTTPEPPKKDKAPVHQYFYQNVSIQSSDLDSDSSSDNNSNSYEQSSSNSESQYADIFLDYSWFTYCRRI